MLSSSPRAYRAALALADWLVRDIRKELATQGHNLSGSLSNSVQGKITSDDEDGFELDIEHVKYGTYVNYGVDASRIAYYPGSGRKTSLYIQALTDWVQRRGMATEEKAARGIAFAIARTHKKEGMPSRGSYAFSGNGRRTGFVTYTADQAEPDIEQAILMLYELYTEDEIDEMMNEIANQFQDVISWS
jgi:hypothetical protein